MKYTIASTFSGRFFSTSAALLVLCAALPVAAETLTGAGSGAGAPVYRAWAELYGRKQDVKLYFEPSGSAAGVQKIRARAVAFGATDVALSAQELAKDQLVLVPTFVTGTVPVVNLPKIANGKLRLSGEVLAAMYLGTVTRWNAPEIQELNPGMALPDLAVKMIGRNDASGTSFYFTDYLSRVSPTWKEKFGAHTVNVWPSHVATVKGFDTMAKTVKETTGAVGYVDYNLAVGENLNIVQLRNATGDFVAPNVESFRLALQKSEWTTKGNFLSSLSNLSGHGVWPITMGTFILLPKTADKPADTTRALKFFAWTLFHGDQVAEGMGFVRLPDTMQSVAFKLLASVTDQQGHALGMEALTAESQQ